MSPRPAVRPPATPDPDTRPSLAIDRDRDCPRHGWVVAVAAAVAVAAPAVLARLRVPRDPERTPPRAATTGIGHHDPTGPVVLVLPAHDEQELVGGVVARVPAAVHGHPVVCLVVDDGSGDDTAAIAAAAGARVVSLPRNRGLGAAVRRGLAEALALDPVAIAFCDADGEYAPEELDRMVAPILADEADYVVGSRFDGNIEHMLPHRRFGNRVLTHLVRFVTRQPVNDGQSGYRAFRPAAAADARIVHDFNYAQVLTIDLVRKGWRYREVPISYRFREAGESFVTLGRYLRAVTPAIWRALHDPLEPAPGPSRATSDPVGARAGAPPPGRPATDAGTT